MIFDHGDAICPQTALGLIANVPVDHAAESKGAKTSSPFLAMQVAPLFAGTMPACLPRTAKARKQRFGICVRDAVAVVTHLNRPKSAKLIFMKQDIDPVRVAIDRVPNQLGNSKNWLSDLGNPLKVIVLNLNLECLADHAQILTRTKRRVKDNVSQWTTYRQLFIVLFLFERSTGVVER
jgi:hypothetical protein